MGIMSKLGSILRGKRHNALVKSPYTPGSNDSAVMRRIYQDMITRSARPQDLLPGFWNDRPKWPDWNSETAIQLGFKGSSWVYVGCMKNAVALSRVPWLVEQRQADGSWQHEPDHPAQILLDNPNPYWSRQQFIMRVVLELMITGNSVIGKVRIGGDPDSENPQTSGVPAELFTVRPQRIAPIPTDSEFIRAYEVIDGGGQKVEIPAENTVHIMLPDPECVYWGMSPLQAAMRAYDVDREAANWQKTTLQNMMIPPGVFTFDKTITKEQFTAALEQLKAQYQGAMNAGSPLLLGNGANYTPLSISPQEVSFLESRGWSRDEILAILGVPLEVVISSGSTYANASTARRIWWEDTLIPLGDLIGGAFNSQLVSEFSDPKQYRVRPDTSGIHALIERINEVLDAALKLRQMGYTTNQINRRLNLGMPEVPWGDTGWVSNSESPVDLMLADVDTF